MLSSCISIYYFSGHDKLVDIKGYLKTLGRPTVTNVGLVLGLSFTTIRDLPNDHHFLNQVITLWLDKADNVGSKGEPSWRSLVLGLKHDTVRQNGISNNIAIHHCTTDVQLSQGMLPYCSA